MKQLLKYLFLGIVGGSIYYGIEILYRGYSHWTMFICGMLCFIGMGLINSVLSWDTPLWIQMLIGGFGIVTPLEFITGYIVNIQLGWNVWNYTNPTSFMGQISLYSSIGWCFLSLVGIVLDDYLRHWIFHETKPRYKLF